MDDPQESNHYYALHSTTRSKRVRTENLYSASEALIKISLMFHKQFGFQSSKRTTVLKQDLVKLLKNLLAS